MILASVGRDRRGFRVIRATGHFCGVSWTMSLEVGLSLGPWALLAFEGIVLWAQAGVWG